MMTTKRRRLLALALTAAMAMSACGSDPDDQTADLPSLTSVDEAASTDTSEEQRDEEGDEEVDEALVMAEYEACLADLGIDVSGIGGGGSGEAVQELEVDIDDQGGTPDFDSFEAATAQCDEILEDAFGEFELSPEQEAEQADAMLELQRCMAAKGFEIQLDGGAFELDENVDFAEFEQAMNVCGNDVQSTEIEPGQ